MEDLNTMELKTFGVEPDGFHIVFCHRIIIGNIGERGRQSPGQCILGHLLLHSYGNNVEELSTRYIVEYFLTSCQRQDVISIK